MTQPCGAPKYGATEEDASSRPKDEVHRKGDAARAQENGFAGVIVMYTNLILGSALLSVPYLIARNGIVLTHVLLLLFCTLAVSNVRMLIEVGEEVGIMDFSRVVEKVCGRQVAAVSDFMICCAFFGKICGAYNAVGMLGSTAYSIIFPTGSPALRSYAGFMVFCSVVFIMTVTLKRSLGEFFVVSTLSTIAMMCVICFVAVFGETDSSERYPFAVWPTSMWGLEEDLGDYPHLFGIVICCFEVYVSATPATKRKFTVATGTALYAALGLCSVMGVVGYAAFGPSVKSDVLLSFSGTPTTAVADTVMVIQLILHIPVNFVVFRLFFLKLCRVDVLEMPAPLFITSSLLLFAIPLVTMALIPYSAVNGVFALILNLNGSFPIACVCFVMPGMLHLGVFGIEKRPCAVMLTVCAGALCMILGPIMDAVTFVKACAGDGCDSW